MEARYELYPLGERAVVIRWEGGITEAMQQRVTEAQRLLESGTLSAVQELVRAYRTITVFYDPLRLYREERQRMSLTGRVGAIAPSDSDQTGEPRSPYRIVCEWIRTRLREMEEPGAGSGKRGEGHERRLTVPVCFGGEHGPDLALIAEQAGMTSGQAIELYCSVEYIVHMIGFVPGFPYMGGLPQPLAAPRRSEPRLKVPAGSVGIAGVQTGIYPQAIPGGWQLIGRTPVRLFDAYQEPPALFRSGDRVLFQPIGAADFERLHREAEHGGKALLPSEEDRR
ncbi:5-oxoprolinase subunit PxpB [Paenibacillus rigui]|uniref:Carboxyltransferase domain-containing protein n=1 Tax=Paenibacillus rigui TaxID=554312 RepID=A0A229UP45_9BACL|nr:5-oxoprolinase subunit PxpB [Paenibacillus rigui]OXM85307.1 hypothetical protein CF651_17115 [Paenibacillus rigui]